MSEQCKPEPCQDESFKCSDTDSCQSSETSSQPESQLESPDPEPELKSTETKPEQLPQAKEVSTVQTPRTLQYSPASMDMRAYYSDYCSASSNIYKSKYRFVYIIGAPEDRALKIIGMLSKRFEPKSRFSRSPPEVFFKWWQEGPPGYDGKKQGGRWAGPNGNSAIQELQYPATVLMYYAEGCDPLGTVKRIPHGQELVFGANRQLFPIAEVLLDSESSKDTICAYYGPLLFVKLAGSSYYAPIFINILHNIPLETLLQKGGAKYTLGEMSSDFDKTRNKRKAFR